MDPLRGGAVVGSGGDADLRPMVRFGFYLGAAFQIQDDLLNLLGTEREYGKEIDGDLYERERARVRRERGRGPLGGQADAAAHPPAAQRSRGRPRNRRPLPAAGALR